MRIFTNEVATANAFARAGCRSEAVAWEDALSFGRLSPELAASSYAADRAASLAEAGWDEDGTLEQDIVWRFTELASAFASGEEVVFVFGGSLRDQLQLAQLMAWLAGREPEERERARLMAVDGPLSVFEDGALREVAKEAGPVDGTSLALYRGAWQAATCPDPRLVAAARETAASGGFSSLAAALGRWLQELPSVENGLSITQAQTLDAARVGVAFPQELYEAVEETEALPFRTNWEFWQTLEGLCAGPDPLLAVAGGKQFLCPPRDLAWLPFHDQRLELTDRGRATLEGKAHFASGAFFERWLGGVRLDGSRWFFDYASGTVVERLGAGSTADG